MEGIRFRKLKLEGLLEVRPFCAEDERGYFLKGFENGVFRKQGRTGQISECNESRSKQGVVRGLHFQHEKPQAKLVRPVSGTIFDVAVDLRPGSATFGMWEGIYLDDKKHNALYVPEGFAHGFLVVSRDAVVTYQCWGAYVPELDMGINWQDPDIKVDWPLHLVGEVTLSKKDGSLQSFREYQRLYL